MANKKINELDQIDAGERDGGLANNDLLPVYDSSEAGIEKTKKIQAQRIIIPQINPYSGYAGITLTCMPLYKAIESDRDLTYRIKVTALEVIRTIHGGDGTGIIYEISKDNILWISSSSPKDASITYVCGADLSEGTTILYVRVKDSTYTSNVLEIFMVVLNPNGYPCGGP